MPEAEVQRISDFVFLLRGGGLPFLAVGLALAIAGIVLASRRRPRTAISIIAWLSPLPGILALFAIYSACTQFTEMGSSPQAPKPSEFASVIAKAMSAGFFGIIGTIASMSAALAALARSRSQPEDN